MKDKPEILLIRWYQDKARLLSQRFPSESLALGYLASYLSINGYSVKILDTTCMELKLDNLLQQAKNRNVILIGITTDTESGPQIISIVKTLKKRGVKAPICLGGYWATFAYSEILRAHPYIDFIVRGEGETALLNLTNYLCCNREDLSIPGVALVRDNNIIWDNRIKLVSNLDVLPFPLRYYPYELRNGIFAMYTARGCYYSCNFCSIHKFYSLSKGHRRRCRSVENTVQEIEELIKMGARHINFHDDEFIGGNIKDKERIHLLADELLKKQFRITFTIQCRADSVDKELFKHLKEAGLLTVGLGIEAWEQEELDYFNKRISREVNLQALKILDELNINTQIFQIFLHPKTTFEDLRKRHVYNKNLKVYQRDVECGLMGSQLKVHKGTNFAYIFKKEGILRQNLSDFQYEYDIRDIKINKFLDIYQILEKNNRVFRNQCEFLYRILGQKGYFSPKRYLVLILNKFMKDLQLYQIEIIDKCLNFLRDNSESSPVFSNSPTFKQYQKDFANLLWFIKTIGKYLGNELPKGKIYLTLFKKNGLLFYPDKLLFVQLTYPMFRSVVFHSKDSKSQSLIPKDLKRLLSLLGTESKVPNVVIKN